MFFVPGVSNITADVLSLPFGKAEPKEETQQRDLTKTQKTQWNSIIQNEKIYRLELDYNKDIGPTEEQKLTWNRHLDVDLIHPGVKITYDPLKQKNKKYNKGNS
jgi:hypothetical protein